MKLAVFALCSALAAAASAAERRPAPGGALEVIAPDGTSRGACPLERTDVGVEVAGFVARVAVTQVFRNPLPDPVEAVYTFPLSERGAVDAMTMKTGDRVIVAEIDRRDEARRRYEAARQAGQVASLLDQERPNVFTQSLANLMPGATVAIRIEYVEPLAFREGTFELVVPTVVGPRFVPPAGVPDADRITPPVTPEGTRAGHDVTIAADIDAGMPIGDVTAPLHAIDVERPAPERVRVRLRQEREIPNRDFVLRWTVATDQVQSTVLAHRVAGDDGYVSVILLPPKRVAAEAAAPKEMLFVIDRSGSQMGAPLDKAKETMRWVLDHLHPHDTFQVIDFGSTSSQLFPAPRRATAEARRQARSYIDALQANGGTMMADAVQRACATPADAHRLRIVTFMTDGYVGNDLEVLDLVRRLRGTSRWFPFGTGNGVNRFLIDGMARLGGGEAYYALLSESGDRVAQAFYDHVASPALTDVRVAWEGLDVVDVHPDVPGDVWAEKPLVIHGRYRTPGRGRVILTGFQQGRPYRQELPVVLPAEDAEHDAIASVWARAKVETLTTQDLAGLQSGTFPTPLRAEIESVALAHRLVTAFTSFVAAEERVVNEGGTQRTVRVPVEMPDGVRYEGIFGDAGAPDGRARGGAARALPTMLFPAQQGMPGRQLAAAPPEPSDEAEVPRSPVALSDAARGRLAPGLRVLVEQGPGAVGAAACADGWVSVELELADASAAALRAVQAAGLVVERIDGRRVRGVVALHRLAALAELTEVARIESRVA